ncbi:hypothetical protein RMSM_02640 [Rhodopirellula maiorica SM1]|uniref:Uncharacterized protein n=1 Tax=Rhodopirellula maiorica SM1 TaxID=1265738 RepID=M5RYF8_9BACT|nr:hypothetical protein [Rhodopirellula maiorica]EMI20432.1 hypothetical protein RMSM_02640 [Rhodopirellula maiorica SM1]
MALADPLPQQVAPTLQQYARFAQQVGLPAKLAISLVAAVVSAFLPQHRAFTEQQ